MADIECGRFDANLGDIMQNVRQIDSFLHVIFEFLYRRTDFYRLMRHENDNMGLPPGVARKYVMQAYMKYERLSRGVEATYQPPAEKQPSSSEKADDVPVAVQSVEVAATDVSALPGSSQATEGDPAVGPAGGTEGADSEPSSAVARPVVTNPDTGEIIQDAACAGVSADPNTSAPEASCEEKGVSSTRPPLNQADTYNGALRDNYAWSQTLKDVDIKVFVPATVTKAKQLSVDVRNDKIKVAIEGSSSDGEGQRVLVEGQLTEKVRGEETLWSLDPGNCVQLNLEKRKEVWWKAAFVGEPEIDQKSIDNVQHVHELDEESQADYHRVVYDMERKRQGLPTSKEEEVQGMLRKAWDADGSPFKGSEFDPSKVNISAS